MADPYIGEIRAVGFNFAPVGWAFCNGATLSISDYDTLFVLLGTTFGGDGQTTFNLPNLNGRVAVHMGTGTTGTIQIGEISGTEDVTLTSTQLPNHTHSVAAVAASGNVSSPAGAYIAASTVNQFGPVASATAAMAPAAITPSGGSQPHPNIQPYLTLNYIISLYGVFPSQG
jgi:microcystin-dependent protein